MTESVLFAVVSELKPDFPKRQGSPGKTKNDFGSRNSAHTILETWAKRCDDFIFFTDSPMSAEIPHIYWKELHSRDHSWEKIRRIFNHVIDDMEDEYDWYLRADDDAYVIVENLRHFLANYSSKEPHYFGYRWNFFVPHGYADGGVYVLSRPAVEVFNRVMEDPKLCPELHRAEEDQE
ncbi:hypothetical protein ANCCEY_15076, partial [Ancylostoma ceylanicum]